MIPRTRPRAVSKAVSNINSDATGVDISNRPHGFGKLRKS